jgi:hypothetical protein
MGHWTEHLRLKDKLKEASEVYFEGMTQPMIPEVQQDSIIPNISNHWSKIAQYLHTHKCCKAYDWSCFLAEYTYKCIIMYKLMLHLCVTMCPLWLHVCSNIFLLINFWNHVTLLQWHFNISEILKHCTQCSPCVCQVLHVRPLVLNSDFLQHTVLTTSAQ